MQERKLVGKRTQQAGDDWIDRTQQMVSMAFRNALFGVERIKHLAPITPLSARHDKPSTG